MIIKNKVYKCTKCKSENIVKNGHNKKGKQKFHCKDCNRWSILEPSVRYTEKDKEKIINAYYERSSMRGIERVFGVARQTLAVWLKKRVEVTTPGKNS